METKIRAIQVPKPGGDLELVERDLPEPGRGQVRVRVQACGICHSDTLASLGMAASYPRVPGHEVAGVIDAVGEDVSAWQPGQRVGIGWFGGACSTCDSCRRGNIINCTGFQVTGLAFDGGYEEAMLAPSDALAAIPDDMSAEEAAPLMCAGVTTFNGLRRSRASAGDLVAILGLGGLGHLGVQFAVKMGFETVAIARGQEKADFARQLGAHHYIDSTSQDVAGELTRLGGPSVVLATVTNGPAMTATIPGLGPGGQLVIVGVPPEPLQIGARDLIGGSRSVVGHPNGTAKDSEDTLAFASLTGIRPMIETFPLERAAEGYERMLSGQARFRAVLTTARPTGN
jgi:D-arabinose 1-dehydrogenase-like Zn-dependent alcohol dehydrogenase